MLIQTLTVVHIVVSFLMIGFVLLQFGKGAETGFLGGSEGAIFTSSQSGNILTKVTTILAILFLGLSVTLAVLRSHQSDRSVFDTEEVPLNIPLNYDEANAPSPNENTKDTPTTETP